MSSVLVLPSYLWGKFRKRLDGTVQCRPSCSWPRTDGLPRCEHCSGPPSPPGPRPHPASHPLLIGDARPQYWSPAISLSNAGLVLCDCVAHFGSCLWLRPVFSTVRGPCRARRWTAKSPRREGAVKGGPFLSGKLRDGRHC